MCEQQGLCLIRSLQAALTREHLPRTTLGRLDLEKANRLGRNPSPRATVVDCRGEGAETGLVTMQSFGVSTAMQTRCSFRAQRSTLLIEAAILTKEMSPVFPGSFRSS